MVCPAALHVKIQLCAVIPVRQQQLLGSKGTLSSHVLLTADGDTAAAAADPPGLNAQQSSTAGASAGAGFGSGQYAGGSFGGGLLSHSLVVQTGLGSYVQVGVGAGCLCT
jgi:hypothetical protein